MNEPYPASGRRVITAEDVERSPSPFVVPQGAILTPLALDLLRQRGELPGTAGAGRRGRTVAPLVVANWKSNKTVGEARAFAKSFVRPKGNTRVVVCPPFTTLSPLGEALAGAAELGAQDVSPFEEGAHTGEVAARHLVEVGVRFVIIGHSERRGELGENDELVRRKTRAAFAGGLTPIVCVGETRDERAAGRTSTVVRGQVRAFADGLDPARAVSLVVAYEPRWAIGAGVTPTNAEIGAVITDVRRELDRCLGERAAASGGVLYGGSVTPDNAGEISAIEGVSGFLVGGASLDPKKLVAIANACR